ncbi:MAG: hypothetical protein RR275_02070 [Lachnospiraceae bacterium]
MGHRILAICDSELLYANNLMEMITQRKELTVEVRVFSVLEKLKLFSKEQSIDILLIDELYSLEQRKEIKANRTFVITRGGETQGEEQEIMLYKYQSVERILEQIMQACMEEAESMFLYYNKNKVKLWGVYSPIHRVGKTTFALTLGKQLAQEQKTLYINLEEYAGIGETFGNGSHTLADLLYYSKQEHSNIGMRMAGMVKQEEELEYIDPIPVSRDLKATTVEEWLLLFEKMKEKSIYENMILDFGESIQGLLELLKACDEIYMPMAEDRIAVAKMRQYEENLRILGEEKLMEKTHQIVLPRELELRNYVKQLLEKEEKM